ncbi:hypothetical protein A9Q98_13100 [Thalassotalea sp. 42_200_T64]|nr:hypothetical protein A9Q98_13100 [Thalassotalea sp. 42_200_T64]
MKTAALTIDSTQRPQFISKRGLLLIFVVVVVLAWLVYPRSLFIEREEGNKVTKLSLAYLKVLLSRNPDDIDIRLKLADQQFHFWQEDKAWQTISPLVHEDDARVNYLALKIRYQQLINAEQVANDNNVLHQDVLAMLAKVLASTSADVEVANIAAAMGQHLWAARLFAKLGQDSGDLQYLQLAGSQYLAGNAPKSAENTFQKLYQLQPSPETLYSWAQAVLSNQVTSSQLQWYLSLTLGETSLQYWRVAAQLAMAAGSQSQYLVTQEKIYAITALAKDREQLANAYLGQGQLLKALPLVKQQLNDNRNDPIVHRRIRDLYLWLGQFENYLQQVIWLTEHSPEPTDLAQAAPLAIGQYYFNEAAWLYKKLAQYRPLSDLELTNWFESHYQAGTAEQGADALRSYMDKYGASAHLVAMLARVASDLGDYQQLLSDWALYGRFYQLPPATYNLYSGALWQEGDFETALAALERVPHHDRTVEFWKLYGDLAWLGEQAELAIIAYQQHLQLAPEAEGETVGRLEILLARYQPAEYLSLLVLQFKRYGLPRYLLLSAEILIKQGEIKQLSSLMALAEQNGAFDQLPLVRIYQSWLFEQQGKYAEAILSLQKAYAALPHNSNIQLALLWSVLAHGNEQSLSELVNKLEPVVVNKSPFWQPIALSFERLKKPQRAIPWYQRTLAENKTNYEMMFNYAEALKASGFAVSSHRVKRYMLAKLTENAAQFKKISTFLQLAIWNESRGVAGVLSSPSLYELGNENLLMSYLLQGNRQFSAQKLYQQLNRQNIDIDDSLALRLALQRGDKEQLRHLVAKGLNLPPADRISALVMLDRDREAISWANQHLTDALPLAEQSQLRQQMVAIKPKYAHFAKWSFDSSSAFKANSFSFSYGMPWGGAQHWQTELISDHSDDILLQTGPSLTLTEQLRWKNQWQWFSYDDDFNLASDISWGDGWRRDGMALSWDKRWTKSLMTKGYWEINQVSNASRLANALAEEDIFGISANWSVSGRESLSMAVKSFRYDSHYGDELGDGQALSLTLLERIFAQDPAWEVYFDWRWQQNDLVEGPIVGIANAFEGAAVTATELITPRYGRLALGSRVYRGLPGAIGMDLPSPRFFVDANIGYLYFADQIDFGISTGLGWRLLGADELSITSQYQSSNFQQDNDFKLNINYQIYFD